MVRDSGRRKSKNRKTSRSKSNSKSKGERSSSSSSSMDLPRGMKVNYKSGGTIEEIDKEFKSTYSAMLYLKDGEEESVAFLTQPEDFFRIWEHNLEKVRTSILCTYDKKCIVCNKFPENVAKRVFYAPVYNVGEKRMQYFRCSQTSFDDLAKRADKSASRFMGRVWTISREGEGFDTQYVFDVEDTKVSRRLKYEELEIQDVINRQLSYGLGQAGLLGSGSSSNVDDDDEDDDFDDDLNWDEEDDEDEDED